MTGQPADDLCRRLAELLLGFADLAGLLPPGAVPAGRGEPGRRRLATADLGRLAGACGAFGLAVSEDDDGVPWVETALDCGHPGGALLLAHFARLARTLGVFDAELALRVDGSTARVRATAAGAPGLTDGCFLLALVCRAAARRLAAGCGTAARPAPAEPSPAPGRRRPPSRSTAGGRLDPAGAAAHGPLGPPPLDDLPPPAGWHQSADPGTGPGTGPDTGTGELVNAWRMPSSSAALCLAADLQAITAAGRVALPLAFEVEADRVTVGLQWRRPRERPLALLFAIVADLLAASAGGVPLAELEARGRAVH